MWYGSLSLGWFVQVWLGSSHSEKNTSPALKVLALWISPDLAHLGQWPVFAWLLQLGQWPGLLLALLALLGWMALLDVDQRHSKGHGWHGPPATVGWAAEATEVVEVVEVEVVEVVEVMDAVVQLLGLLVLLGQGPGLQVQPS